MRKGKEAVETVMSSDEAVAAEIYSVCARGLIPVMVHVERYFKVYANEDDILKKLLGMRVFAQCNCEGIRQFRKRRLVRSIIMMGKLIAIGSDAHNISDRKVII